MRIRREGNFHCSCCCFCCCWCSWRILLFVFSSILSFPSHLSPSHKLLHFPLVENWVVRFFSSLHFFRVLSFNNSSFLQLIWSCEAMKREGSFRAYRLPITAATTPPHPSCSESGTFQPLLASSVPPAVALHMHTGWEEDRVLHVGKRENAPRNTHTHTDRAVLP